MTTRTLWTDEKVEAILANLLRAGVVFSAAIVAAGGMLYLLRHSGDPALYGVFEGEPGDLRSFTGSFAEALAGRGRGTIQLGILFLIATPVARVAFSIYAFVRERDLLYSMVTLLVFCLLLYSLLAQH